MAGIRRRDFIAAAGSTAVAWPLMARAQQPGMPVVGFLSTRSSDESSYLTAAFRRGLAETGHVEGKNLAVEYRWAEEHYGRLPELAAELVHQPVAVLPQLEATPRRWQPKAPVRRFPLYSRSEQTR